MAKQMDNLSLDMIECKKAGFGCHYGAWKATQEPVKPKPMEIPEDWPTCPQCGKRFKPRLKTLQIYCEPNCQHAAAYRRMKERRKMKNEDCN